jgi:hypothetical protein
VPVYFYLKQGRQIYTANATYTFLGIPEYLTGEEEQLLKSRHSLHNLLLMYNAKTNQYFQIIKEIEYLMQKEPKTICILLTGSYKLKFDGHSIPF